MFALVVASAQLWQPEVKPPPCEALLYFLSLWEKLSNKESESLRKVTREKDLGGYLAIFFF